MSKSKLSLFSQKLDRAVFATYFLGAVVPLFVLGGVVHHFALPSLRGDSAATLTMLGVTCGTVLLSLASFFALRRLAGNALQRMEGDNRRLGVLLGVSRRFAAAPHAGVVAEDAARCALELMSADAAFVLMRSHASKPLNLSEGVGDGASSTWSLLEETLVERAEACLASAQSECGEIGAGAASFHVALEPIAAENGTSAVFVMLRRQPGPVFGSKQLDALSTLAALAQVALQGADLQDSQRNFFAHVTEILVAALDSHVDGREGHAAGVAELAHRIGREMGLEAERLERLHFACLLHDIGMLKVDRRHQRDASHFQKHAAIGSRMLSRIRLWEHLSEIVLHHHERWDGSGYPEGQMGEQIPLESRVIAVADAVDAMSRKEAGRPTMAPAAVLAELRREAGEQFDPAVVSAYARVVESE